MEEGRKPLSKKEIEGPEEASPEDQEKEINEPPLEAKKGEASTEENNPVNGKANTTEGSETEPGTPTEAEPIADIETEAVPPSGSAAQSEENEAAKVDSPEGGHAPLAKENEGLTEVSEVNHTAEATDDAVGTETSPKTMDSPREGGSPVVATPDATADEIAAETETSEAKTESVAAAVKATPAESVNKPATAASEPADSTEENASNTSEEAEDQDPSTSPQKEEEEDYAAMNMENLVGELQRLLRTESIAHISKKVNQIRQEFDKKFREHLEEKKEEFVENGGNEIDFRYQSVSKRQFNELMAEYREKRDQHYKEVERELKKNLEARQAIIEELKSLINVEEDMHHTYKNFKEIQERWRNAGPVPRNEYNNLWQTYHHHTEIFYDFLHLNRELRDLDFQHNLEEKEKLIARAEELKDEPDLNKALFELQSLHRMWKEDIGPVAKEKREDVWNRFSEATKALHHRRQEHLKILEADQKINLERKLELIARINEIAGNVAEEHKALQFQIRDIDKLREEFLAIGMVPKSQRDETWAAFKQAVRSFNRRKNSLYKDLKNEQLENLRKKRALIEKAVALKDSDDHEVVTPEMKRIQNEWKKIGHVPRKYSDKIWKEFKGACNEYFDRVHGEKRKEQKAEMENFKKKKDLMDRMAKAKLTGEREKDLKTIKAFIAEWKQIGHVPGNKRDINDSFNKKVDQLFAQLDIDKQQSQILRYGDRLEELSSGSDMKSVLQERSFIKRKIEESRQEIRQLENNMQFFSSSSGKNNPFLAEAEKNIEKLKGSLGVWEEKLKSVNILMHRLKKEKEEAEAKETGEDSSTEDQ